MVTLIKDIPKLKIESAAYTKICCHAEAYIDYEKIALFWKQTDENENITALISLVDSVMTIFNNGADIFELKEFLKCISPIGVFTDLKTAKLLDLKIETECESLIIKPPFSSENVAENTCAGIDYAINIVSSRLNVGNKEVFKADLMHRIRHNCATFVTTDFSAAFCLYSDDYSIVSGIAVKKDSSKSGIGSATLKRLLLSNRERPMLVCAEDKNVPFYLKNGFSIIERCAYCRI